MADLPFAPIDAGVASRLRSAVDPGDKILRAIEALGPVAGRDVVMLGSAPVLARALLGLGSRVTVVEAAGPGHDGSGSTAAEGATPGGARARRSQPARAGAERVATSRADPGSDAPAGAGAVGARSGAATDALAEAGAATIIEVAGTPAATTLATGSADVVVATFQPVPGPEATAVAEVDRVLRPGGRFLVVADYGRDDLDPLRNPDQLAAVIAASRPSGPFLANGFRIRVIHAWWVFADVDAAAELLEAAFGDAARAVVTTMKRPRLAHKVAIFHRARGTDRPAGQGAPADRVG